MTPKTIKIYFGCSLTHAPEEYRHSILALRKSLAEKYQVLEFFSHPTDMQNDQQSLEYCQQIYTHDRNCVLECNLFVAEVSLPSTGLGMELGFAIENDKPILAICQKQHKASRMIRGVQSVDFDYFEYSQDSEALEEVDKFIAKHF